MFLSWSNASSALLSVDGLSSNGQAVEANGVTGMSWVMINVRGSVEIAAARTIFLPRNLFAISTQSLRNLYAVSTRSLRNLYVLNLSPPCRHCSSLLCVSRSSAGRSPMAARKDGGSAAGVSGTGQHAVGKAPNASKGMSGTRSVSPEPAKWPSRNAVDRSRAVSTNAS